VTPLDLPALVVTLTTTERDEVPAGRAGTVAWQVVSVGQRTGAWAGPKSTVISPLGLNNPSPVSVTTCPGAPRAGETASRTGLAPAGFFAGVEVVGLTEVDVVAFAGVEVLGAEELVDFGARLVVLGETVDGVLGGGGEVLEGAPADWAVLRGEPLLLLCSTE